MPLEIYPRSITRSYQVNQRLRWQVYTELRLDGQIVQRQFSYPSAREGQVTLNVYDNHHRIIPVDTNSAFELIEPILETRWTWRAATHNTDPSYDSNYWLKEEFEGINTSIYNGETIRRVEAVIYEPPPQDPNNPDPNAPVLPEPPLPPNYDPNDPSTWPPPPVYLEITRTDYDPFEPDPTVTVTYVLSPHTISTVGMGILHSGEPIYPDDSTEPLPDLPVVYNRYSTLTLYGACTIEFVGRYQFSYPEILARRPLTQHVPFSGNRPSGFPAINLDPIQTFTV